MSDLLQRGTFPDKILHSGFCREVVNRHPRANSHLFPGNGLRAIPQQSRTGNG